MHLDLSFQLDAGRKKNWTKYVVQERESNIMTEKIIYLGELFVISLNSSHNIIRESMSTKRWPGHVACIEALINVI
jgi:hypothetical protein